MTRMQDRWNTEQVWDGLAATFDRNTVDHFRSRSSDIEAAFHEAKKTFRGDVAAMTPGDHDINRDGAKQRLILGHLVLAVLDGMRRGVTEWRPFPQLHNLTWAQKETALLLWAAQHGTSDDHSIRAT